MEEDEEEGGGGGGGITHSQRKQKEWRKRVMMSRPELQHRGQDRVGGVAVSRKKEVGRGK